MNIQHPVTEGTNSSKLPVAADTRLQGRWLALARIVWVAMAGLILVLIVVSIPAEFKYLQMVCTDPGCNGPQFLPEQARELRNLGLSLNTYAAYLLVVQLVFFIVWFTVAVVIFYRKSDERMPWFVSFTLLLYGATFPDLLSSLAHQQSIWLVPVKLVESLGVISIVLFFYIFPNGRFVPRWTRFLAMLFVLYSLIEIPLFDFAVIPSGLELLYLILYLVLLGTSVFAQIYRYVQVSNPVQKQQTKWVLFGFAVAISGFLALNVLAFLSTILPILLPLQQNPIVPFIVQSAYYLFVLLIPLSIGFAVLHYRLWDIDVLINRTLVYGLLTASLALIYFGLVFVMQILLHGLVSQVNNVTIVISTLAIVALFEPLRHRIQGIIDRRFYRRKYDAAKTLAAFSARLRSEVDLDQLSEQLVAVVQETMQPTHVSLWLRTHHRRNRIDEQARV